jgi:hypothetical protein
MLARFRTDYLNKLKKGDPQRSALETGDREVRGSNPATPEIFSSSPGPIDPALTLRSKSILVRWKA